MDPADGEQVDRVVALAREVLGPDLAAVYLHGSATRGGLRHRSDLDLLALSRRRLTERRRRLLVDGLLALSGKPRRPVELTVVAEADLRPWRYPPRRDFQYGEWLRADLEAGADPTGPVDDPDVALLIHMTVLADRPLFGPRPEEVFEAVPDEDLRRALRACVDDVLRGLDDDTTNMLLTLARAWTSMETGEIRTKDAAAVWALDRLTEEHRPVLAHARAVYLGDADEDWGELEPRVRPLADHVAAEIERIYVKTAAGPGRPATA
jgi:predicted nucleotidyltransferase